MIIYNVTTKVDHSISQAWVKWMLEHHIPAVLATGCFERFQMSRMLDTDEEEGLTYAVQYFAASIYHYEKYIEEHANALRKEVLQLWGNKFISFRSLMEIID